MVTLHDFGGVLGRPLDTFFGLSQFHGHGSWLVCEVALADDANWVQSRKDLYPGSSVNEIV